MTQAVRSAAQVQVQVKVKAQAEAKQTEMSTGILSSRDKKYNTRHSIKKGGGGKRRYLKLVDEYSMHRQVRNKQSGKAAASGKGMLKKGVDLNPVRRNLKKKQIRF